MPDFPAARRNRRLASRPNRPRSSRFLAATLTGVAALMLCGAPLRGRDDWQRLHSPDFTILSDASVRDIERFALDYAAYRQTVHELFAPEGVRARRPLIVLFRRQRDFGAHAPESKKRDSRLVMFSTEIDSAALLALPLDGDRRRAIRLAFEFDTIWTLRRFGYFVPTWMSQGAGEVLSTLQLRGDKRVVGLPGETYSPVLQHEGLMRWDRFFGIGVGSAEYDGAKATGQFHAQAWGLMHWVLLEGDGGRERFRALAERLRQEEPLAAVEAVMGVTDLQREGARHVRRTRPPLKLPFDEAAARASWTLAPADPIEVQAYLTDLLAAAGATAQADWEVEKALQANPQHPVVLEAAARRELRQRRPDLAVEHYRAAVAAGSTNPIAYLFSAERRLDDSSRGRDIAGSGIVPAVEAALAEIRRALELDPGSPTGYRLLGRACFLAREVPTGALDDLTRGVGPGEGGAWARFYRGLVAGRLDQTDRAERDFRMLAADPEVSESLRTEARRQLRQLHLNVLRHAVEPLVAARDFAAARDHWTAAAEQFSGDQDEFRRVGAWIDQREAADRRKALQPELDQVQALVGNGRIPQAIAFVEERIASAADEESRGVWTKVRANLDVAAAVTRIRTAFREKDWKEVVRLAEDFLQQDPDSAHAPEIRSRLEKANARLAGSETAEEE